MAVQPYSNLAAAYPNLSGATQQVASNIAKRLRGQLSPETQAAIQDASARFGITSGMPGSGLTRSRTARDLGRATEDLQRAGESDFLNTLQGYSGTIAPTTGQQLQNEQFGLQLGQQESQFGRTLDLQNRELGENKRRFNFQNYIGRPYNSTSSGQVYDALDRPLGYQQRYDYRRYQR